MDVLAGEKRRAHRLVARDVREQPQLDLRIIRIHEHVAGRGDKHFAQSRPQLAPDRFCKFGSVDERRPDAVTVIWKLVWMRPSTPMTFKRPSA